MRIIGELADTLRPLINQMTNWQRNQWAKAGYPVELEQVMHFLDLHRECSN